MGGGGGGGGFFFFFFSSRRRHTRSLCDWSSDVCSSDLANKTVKVIEQIQAAPKAVEKEDFTTKTTSTSQTKRKINIPEISPKKTEAIPMKQIAAPSTEKNLESSKTPAINYQKLASTTTKKLASTQSVTNYRKPQYQQVNANNLIIHKTHSTFLKSRQDFSQQLSEIIQLQIACVEHLFDN